MKNLLRLFLWGSLISMGLCSCGKDSTPVKDKEQATEDGSHNNVRPDGGKYLDVSLVSAAPDWSNIKVGETVTLKFKVISYLDEKRGQYSEMFVNQKVDKGSSMENMNPEISIEPVAAKNLRGTTHGFTSSIVSKKASNDPVYMQVTIKPNYALPTTIAITTSIFDEAKDINHTDKILEYKFTPKN